MPWSTSLTVSKASIGSPCSAPIAVFTPIPRNTPCNIVLSGSNLPAAPKIAPVPAPPSTASFSNLAASPTLLVSSSACPACSRPEAIDKVAACSITFFDRLLRKDSPATFSVSAAKGVIPVSALAPFTGPVKNPASWPRPPATESCHECDLVGSVGATNPNVAESINFSAAISGIRELPPIALREASHAASSPATPARLEAMIALASAERCAVLSS